MASNPCWGVAYRDEDVFVAVTRNPNAAGVQLQFAAGAYVRVALDDWSSWLADDDALAGLRPIEREGAAEALPRLRVAVPDGQALLNRVDWRAKEQIIADEAEQRRAADLQRATERERTNRELDSKAKEGAACPHCGGTDRIHYVDRRPDALSFFVCGSCARSF